MIKTDRYIIRPFLSDDSDDFYEMMSQPEVCRYIPEDVPTRTESDEKLAKLIAGSPDMKLNDKGMINLAVELVAERKVIGWMGMCPVPFRTSVTEAYTTFSSDYWGKGHATAVAVLFLRYAFTELGFDKIVALVIPENTASVRTLQKLGMKYQETITGLDEKFSFFEGVMFYTITLADLNERFSNG